MEYKQLKSITPEAILAVGDRSICFHAEFNEFMKYWGSLTPCFFDSLTNIGYARFYEEMKKHSEWAPWFINHGFIERIKTRKAYQAGNKFHAQGQTYELRCHSWEQHGEGYIAGMFSMTYGADWAGVMVRVKDRGSITEENIKEMFSDIPFEPVKE